MKFSKIEEEKASLIKLKIMFMQKLSYLLMNILVLISCSEHKESKTDKVNTKTRNLLEKSLTEREAIIWHLYHSGFAVKTAHYLMIFDYYERHSAKKGLANGTIEPNEIKDQNVIVFISHGHSDHFFPDCIEWKNTIKNIHYVVSSDIKWRDKRFNQKNIVTQVKPNQSIKVNGVIVKTLKSTDLGVAFLIKVDSLTIYHSGDLACWNWNRTEDATISFLDCLQPLKDEKIDIAFHVAEPGLRNIGWGGILTFVENFRPIILAPMHLQGSYESCLRIKDEIEQKKLKTFVWLMNNPGECVRFKDNKIQKEKE